MGLLLDSGMDQMSEWLDKLFSNTLLVQFGIIIAGIVLIRLITLLIARAFMRYSGGRLKSYKVDKAFDLSSIVLAILLILIVFSNRTSDISLTLGLAGAGIAFALQEVVTSIAGWFAISFAGFYDTGDRVELGGIKGDVIDIGLLRTTLMEIGGWVRGDNYNGRIVRIANSFVFKEPVFNYSAGFPFLWDEVIIPIKYGSNYTLARNIIQKVAYSVAGDWVNAARASLNSMRGRYYMDEASVEPQTVMYPTENWLEFTLRYVVPYKQRRRTKDRIFTAILDEFEKSGSKIDIASPTLEVKTDVTTNPRYFSDDETSLPND